MLWPGKIRSELQVLYSDCDLQWSMGKLCDFLVFFKDTELDSAMPQVYKLLSWEQQLVLHQQL